MLSNEIILESGKFILRAQSFGDKTNPPLLALHGWLDNSASFEPLAKELGDYYVIAPDLMGHGHSEHLPASMIYSFETQVAILFHALNQLGWKNFFVLGHSLGSGIGAALAAALPERVAGLIMLDKLGVPVLPDEGYLPQFLLNMQSGKNADAQPQALYKTAAEAISVRCLISACSEKTAALITGRDLKMVEGGYISRLDRRLHYKSHRALTTNQCHAILRAIKCPALLIKAARGLAVEDNLSQLESCLSHLTSVEITGGHHVHIDDPVTIATYVREFLAPSYLRKAGHHR